MFINPDPGDGPQSRVSQQTTTTTDVARNHGAEAWHTAGITGNGIKVGIIDSGFYGYSTLAARNPAQVPSLSREQVRCYTSPGRHTDNLSDYSPVTLGPGGIPQPKSKEYHGTAVAEAVIDVAPDATLYISNAGYTDLASTVQWMAGQGVKVINHSRGFSWSGTTAIQDVNQAVGYGIVWVNSAGNKAKRTWFSRSYGVSSDDHIAFAINSYCNNIYLRANTKYYFQMRWAGNWGGRNKDLSIEVYRVVVIDDADGFRREVEFFEDSSKNNQPATINSVPFDDINFTPSLEGAYCLKVKFPTGLSSNNHPSWIQLGASGPDLAHNTGDARLHPEGGSITNPAESTSSGMLAVGAAHHAVASVPLNSVIADYSSRGPLPASAVTKPDLVGGVDAYSETHNTFTSKTIFGGTSAAAPHVAGLARAILTGSATCAGTGAGQ